MKRSTAGHRVKQCSYLTSSEKHVLLTLLEVAQNDDCTLLDRWTPTVAALSIQTSLSLATVKRAMRHLEQHGWLCRRSGQGRGHKSSYALLPREPDALCSCEKGSQRTPCVATKGLTMSHKRAHSEPRKGSRGLGNPQVEPGFALREAGIGEGVVSRAPATHLHQCIRCDSTDTQIMSDGSRACREHAGLRWKDTA